MTKRGMFKVMGVREVVNTRNQIGTVHFSIGRYTTHRNAAKIHAVIAPLATDQSSTARIATGPMVAQSNF